MKRIKEYLNRESIRGKMSSIIESARANKKKTFAIIAAVVMIISGSAYIINFLNHNNNSVSINLDVSLTGSIPNMTAGTDIKVGGINSFALGTTSPSSYENNFILTPSNATFLITAVNSSLSTFNTQYVANNATTNSTLLSMISQQQSFMPINDRSMDIVFDHSLNNSWDYSIPFTDLYNNLSQGWREMHFDAIASLSIYGLYNFVFNNHVYAYYYYNAIDYNPYSRTNTLSIEPKFNLSKPFMVKSLQSPGISKIHPGRIIGSGGGSSCRSYSTVMTVYANTMTVPFPLAILSGNVSSIPAMSDSSTCILQSLSYQGVSTIPFSDQYTTSDNPTWSSNHVNVTNSSGSTTSSNTLSMILTISSNSGPDMAFIPNITESVTVTDYGYYVCEGSYYYYISEGSTVSFSMVNQNDNELQLKDGFLDSFWKKGDNVTSTDWNTSMTELTNKLDSTSNPINHLYLGTGAMVSNVDIYGNSTLKASSNGGNGAADLSIAFGIGSVAFGIGSAIATGGLDAPLAFLAVVTGFASITTGLLAMEATPIYAVTSGTFLTSAVFGANGPSATFTEYGSSAGEQLYLPSGSSPLVYSQTGLISVSQ